MSSLFVRLALVLAPCVLSGVLLSISAHSAAAGGASSAGAILVKGAWPSATGSMNSLPEDGTISNHVYLSPYFGLAYPIGLDWTQRYEAPPPSDSGYYVLAQIEPSNPSRTSPRGHVLIAAQDLFFTLAPASNALELVNYYKDHLGGEYRVERSPRMLRIANHDFVRLDYLSSAAGLHWYVLATEIRCHVVQFVFTGANAATTERLIQNMDAVRLPVETDNPVCVKNYATPENLIEGDDPVFTEPRFNPVPVRIVIDRQGKVKNVHFLSAFPEQARSISDALSRWRFKPYLSNGQPVEVETGVAFGRVPLPSILALH
jgi:Gram-negative bacterial TonB protein C-terminal